MKDGDWERALVGLGSVHSAQLRRIGELESMLSELREDNYGTESMAVMDRIDALLQGSAAASTPASRS